MFEVILPLKAQLPLRDCIDKMGDVPNFNLEMDYDSEDDNTLLIIQESKNERNKLNEAGDELDLEEMFNSSKDNAFDCDSSFERLLSTQDVLMQSLEKSTVKSDCGTRYKPIVEDITHSDI